MYVHSSAVTTCRIIQTQERYIFYKELSSEFLGRDQKNLSDDFSAKT